MISPEKQDALQKSFLRLLEPFGATPTAIYAIFDDLCTRHEEPHRHYHTLEHLAEMFRVAGRLAADADDFIAVQLAIWFHDAIYDPTRTDNEAESADLAFIKLAPLGIHLKTLDHVANLILVTDHKTQTPLNRDSQVLLDADLAILGAAPVRYDRYAADIRKEYAHVAQADYKAGRAKVLQSFLSRPQLYLSARMQAEGETLARENLQRELSLLLPEPKDAG
ncbi:MAG: HD domain-containing protein [Fimbriiglobus sp.]